MIFKEKLTPRQRAERRANELGISHKLWFGQCRVRSVAHPRQDFWLELYETSEQSMQQIGYLFGNRDHSTIQHGIVAAAQRAGE